MSVRKCGGGDPAGDLDFTLDDLFINSTTTTTSTSSTAATSAPAPADPEEAELQQVMMPLLRESGNCLRAIREYKENTEVLRAAMGAPKDDSLQLRAFNSLLPNIALIKDAYDLAARLGQELPRLLSFLIARKGELRGHQVLLKQLADVLEFASAWDLAKMLKPAIQNDFSYYRRYYNKMAPRVVASGIKVQEAEAGLISMFIAQSLPMTVMVENAIKASDRGSGSGSAGSGGEAVQLIGILANVTCDLAWRQELPEDTRQYAMRVMASAMVIYDRVSATGVFNRRSPVRTRKCLRTLRKEQDDGTSSADLAQQLLNSVKYSTIHFKDGSTPSYVRTLLGSG
jgi:hypothetical protein